MEWGFAHEFKNSEWNWNLPTSFCNSKWKRKFAYKFFNSEWNGNFPINKFPMNFLLVLPLKFWIHNFVHLGAPYTVCKYVMVSLPLYTTDSALNWPCTLNAGHCIPKQWIQNCYPRYQLNTSTVCLNVCMAVQLLLYLDYVSAVNIQIKQFAIYKVMENRSILLFSIINIVNYTCWSKKFSQITVHESYQSTNQNLLCLLHMQPP